ncbi:ribosomal protein S18 acetylase RimI-like enzyme [Streptosporangium becharense]|uniref:Ribosomal protein S18 acetylase RimI-like enzyme n=1 Tax=Streptosporangium becharense TaxID=1816182 RepID=A0A7W9IKW4_9ACTN|nr:GNAT family N-acetyltransferase [Streptosporangium becharense]MBB2911625.1 ribosomal protein S18 acetylase RimI-like enzyme [Streptosporangium becharense]MBB5822557.1 ribosomal protein S18 acetylase RimI-like enzyme [Streptosporangium becharense]
MSWQDVTEARDVRAVASPLESARFGLTVERVTVPAGSGASFAEVGAAVLESAADVVVLRYPAEHVGWFAGLTGLGGTAVFADSLVYWRLPAGAGRAPEPVPELSVSGPPAPAEVRELVAAVFAAYGNHYLANPLLDPAAALAGYQEWASRAAAGGGCLTLEHREAGEGRPRLAGLATLEDEGPRTEILLAGVVPGLQGRGLYAHLLRAVEERALARGATEVVISTQGHNTRVQRAWARYGFEPVQTLLTVHLVRSPLPRAHGRDPLPLAGER